MNNVQSKNHKRKYVKNTLKTILKNQSSWPPGEDKLTMMLDAGAVMVTEEASDEGLGDKGLTLAESLILFSCSVPWIIYSTC